MEQPIEFLECFLERACTITERLPISELIYRPRKSVLIPGDWGAPVARMDPHTRPREASIAGYIRTRGRRASTTDDAGAHQPRAPATLLLSHMTSPMTRTSSPPRLVAGYGLPPRSPLHLCRPTSPCQAHSWPSCCPPLLRLTTTKHITHHVGTSTSRKRSSSRNGSAGHARQRSRFRFQTCGSRNQCLHHRED